MPRNSTGNYTLPLPPVVAGELIEAPWANTSLDDIGQALTDSLDRYGRGGMLAPFLFADGTLSNPGAAWANAPGTGIFRDSTHLGFVWNGEEILSVNGNGLITSKGLLVGASSQFNTQIVFGNGPTPTATPWILRCDQTPASDNFELFNANLGTLAFVVEPSANGVTFLGAVGVNGALQIFKDWNGLQFFDTAGTKVGDLFGRPDGGLTLYAQDITAAPGNVNVIDFLWDKTIFKKAIEIENDATTGASGINFAQNGTALYSFSDTLAIYLPDGISFAANGTAGRLATLTSAGNFSTLGGIGATGTVSAGAGGSIFADWMRVRKADNTSWYHLAIAGDGGMQIWDYAFSAIMMQVTQAGDIRGRRIIATASP